MVGPNQERWERWLAAANEQHVGEAGRSWKHAEDLLRGVQTRLERAAEQAYVMGGHTGPAMREAFTRSAEAMTRKADQLRDGGAALLDVATVVAQARQARSELGPGAPAPAAPPAPTSGQPTKADLPAQSRYRAQVQAHQAQEAHREEVARSWTAHMDTTYTRSARTMQSIHGEPDPTPTSHHPQGPTSPALTPPPPGGHQPPASTPNGGGHPGGGVNRPGFRGGSVTWFRPR
ncbi:MAG: hypothetical protein JWN22_2841 [Nocardioides sp.]|nr:hypothetical protein [Nocardioides sp.]